MRPLRLLITDPTPERWRSLENRLRKEQKFELVGHVPNLVDLLMAVRTNEADAVVLFRSETEQGILSHLFAEFPDLTVLVLEPSGRAFIEQRCPSRRAIADSSATGLVEALRHAITQPCSELDHEGTN